MAHSLTVLPPTLQPSEAETIARLLLQTVDDLAVYWIGAREAARDQSRSASSPHPYPCPCPPREDLGILLDLLEIVALAVRPAEQRSAFTDKAATFGSLRASIATAMLIIAETHALDYSSDQVM